MRALPRGRPAGAARMRRGVLLAMLVAGAATTPLGPAPASAETRELAAAIEDRLRFALAVLCPRCDNDIEAEGVNRPMRRAMVAGNALADAREGLEEAVRQGDPRHGAALAPVRRALQALESVDEDGAAREARRALRMVEALRR